MRSERFKQICQLLADGVIRVLPSDDIEELTTESGSNRAIKRRTGGLRQFDVRIESSILLQISREELADAIQGYMGSNMHVTNIEVYNGEDGFMYLRVDMVAARAQ